MAGRSPVSFQRYLVAGTVAVGSFFAGAHKVNFNIALVAMVVHPEHYATTTQSFSYPSMGSLFENATTRPPDTPATGERFPWTEFQQGVMLSAFYYGYLAPQLLAGFLADRLSAKHTMGISVLLSGLLSLLTPAAARWDWRAVVAVRALVGLAQGFVPSCMFALASSWSPLQERSRYLTVSFLGYSLSSVVTIPVTGALTAGGVLGGWPSSFYIFGGLAIVWVTLWLLVGSNSPRDHRWISVDELHYILMDKDEPERASFTGVPWRSIFTSGPVWAILVAKTATGFGLTVFLTKLPAYMATILGMDIKKNALMNGLLNTAMMLSGLLWAYIADQLLLKAIMRARNVRRLFTFLCLGGSAACIGAVPVMGLHAAPVMALLVLSVIFYACEAGGHLPNIVEIAPKFSGIIYGVCNTWASLAAMTSPMLAGWLLEKGNNVTQWSCIFYICAALYVTAAVLYVLLCSGEVQPWASGNSPMVQETTNRPTENVDHPSIQA